MMKFIQNGEPYVFEHKCSQPEKGQIMSQAEKREFLVENLLDIYSRCNMAASRCVKPTLSFLDKIRGKKISSLYPDIVIDNYHGTQGAKAYYIVLPKGTSFNEFNIEDLPLQMRKSYIKVIYGSVFCLEDQTPEKYKKGCHFAAQYQSKAINPPQINRPLPNSYSDKELAILYAESWQKLDSSLLKDYLDKDFHYINDSVFDDMSSRQEYLDYLEGKFKTLHTTQSIKRVQLGRNGESGSWIVLIKQIQDNGVPIVCGFFIESLNGRIMSIEVHEMDLPDF